MSKFFQRASISLIFFFSCLAPHTLASDHSSPLHSDDAEATTLHKAGALTDAPAVSSSHSSSLERLAQRGRQRFGHQATSAALPHIEPGGENIGNHLQLPIGAQRSFDRFTLAGPTDAAKTGNLLKILEEAFNQDEALSSSVELFCALKSNCFNQHSYDEIMEMKTNQSIAYYLGLLSGATSSVLRVLMGLGIESGWFSMAFGALSAIDVALTTYNSHIALKISNLQEIIYKIFVSQETGTVDKTGLQELDKKLYMIAHNTVGYVKERDLIDQSITAKTAEIEKILRIMSSTRQCTNVITMGLKGLTFLSSTIAASTLGRSEFPKDASMIMMAISAAANSVADRRDGSLVISDDFFYKRLKVGELFCLCVGVLEYMEKNYPGDSPPSLDDLSFQEPEMA
jgi:hypothetical protein